MSNDKNIQKSIANWEKEYKKGFTAYIVLVFLKNQTMYGYEIRKKLEELTDNSITYQDSAIYQILKRLSQNKLVTFETRKSYHGPPRKYYTITDSGLKAVNLFTQKHVRPIQRAISVLLADHFPEDS